MELGELQPLLLALFTLAPVSFQILDVDGRSVLVNRAYLALFGAAPPAEYRVFEDEVASASGLDALIRRAFGGETITLPPCWYELRHEDVDRRVAIELTVFPLPADDGAIRHVAVCHDDVTASQQLASRGIEEGNRLKCEFVASMARELRTPLNAIIGFAEVLQDGQVASTSSRHKELLGDILAGGHHLARQINDILDLARIETGTLAFRTEPTILAELIPEVVAALRTHAAARRLRVELDLDPALPEVALDRARLKQVLYNYLSNALKFGAPGSRVVVRTRAEPGERFRIEVEDAGAGIPSAQLGRLFLEFQPADSGPAGRPAGTGVGLALTRRLVEAQGGTVGVASTVGLGSVFHAVLPRRTGASTPRRARRTFEAPRPRGRLLVAAGDPRDQGVLIDVLVTAGYTIEVVGRGADALACAREAAFDAILLGLLLPDMNGLELMRGLRAGGRHADVPTVVTAVGADRRAVTGFAIHGVLDKPLDAAATTAALRRAGVPPTTTSPVLVVDDDARARRSIEAALQPLGYRVVGHADATAGLDAAAREAPAAVVIDPLRAGADAFALVARLRGEPRHAATPILLWSARQLTRDDELRLAASAEAVLAGLGAPEARDQMLAAIVPAPPEA